MGREGSAYYGWWVGAGGRVGEWVDAWVNWWVGGRLAEFVGGKVTRREQ